MTPCRGLGLILLASLLVLLPPTAEVRAQENGSLAGQLVNGTAGASPPADVEVVVHILQNRAKTGERRVRTAPDGSFRVDGLATGPDTLYFPIVQYGGVGYYPDQPVTLAGAETASVKITVFEATPRPDTIAYERLNMLVMGVSPTSLSIMEMGSVVNSGDRTYAADPTVTGSARTLRFSLPDGAIQVSPQAGLPIDTLETTPDGFATTDPVRPGRREIAFSYQLPYSSSSVDLARSFQFPVSAFTVYVPPDVSDVVAPGMALQGTTDFGGRQFRQYAVQGVASGAEVRFRMTGLPAPLFARPRDLGMFVSGVTAIALGVFLLVAVRRRWGRAAESTADAAERVVAPTPERADERLALVRAVAELDDRFASGAIDEAEYQRQRSEQKARLVALTRSPMGAP